MIPKSSEEELRQLNALASEKSYLSRQFSELSSKGEQLLPVLLEEAWSCAKRDGISIAQNDILDIWTRKKEPVHAEELILSRFFTLFQHASNYAARPLTLTLAQDLHAELMFGIGESGASVPRQYGDELYLLDRISDLDYVSFRIGASAEEGSANDFGLILIGAVELSSTFWSTAPFKSANSLVECLMRRIYFLQRGLPLLSYVPITNMLENGTAQFASKYEKNHWVLLERVGTGEGIDVTLYYMGAVSSYLEGMRAIEDRVRRIEQESQKIAESPQLTGLTKRQRDFMVMARHRLNAEFSIQSYMALYHVAYATARHDLLDLTERKLLTMKKRGKAFYFEAARLAK